MKTTLTLLLSFVAMAIVHAQTVAKFENFDIMPDEFLNGSDLNGGFESGNVFLPNNFNESYQSWLGWAVSATTDTVTPGFNNQYSAIAGQGAEGSATYAVNFSFGANIIRLTEGARGGEVNGLFITNSTYAYRSMLEGDAFAKRFGGETGDDPDFFKLTIKQYFNGSIGGDSIDFFLADYRFDNNDEDYLVRDWTWVDLTSLGDCDSLSFSLSSSDNGQFGMNTPAFFCIDNVTTEDVITSITNIQADLDINIYPNPASDVVRVECDCGDGKARLVDVRGVVVSQAVHRDGQSVFDLGDAPTGVYYLQLITGTGIITQAIMKN